MYALGTDRLRGREKQGDKVNDKCRIRSESRFQSVHTEIVHDIADRGPTALPLKVDRYR